MTRGDLGPQGIEESFHLRSPLSLSHLVAVAESWRPAVWRGCLRRIRFARKLTDLLVLKGVMVCTRHIWNTLA